MPQPQPFFEGINLSGVRVWVQDQIYAPPTGIKAIRNGVAYIVGVDTADARNKLFLLDTATGQIKTRIDVSSIITGDFNVGVGPEGQVFATFRNHIYRIQ